MFDFLRRVDWFVVLGYIIAPAVLWAVAIYLFYKVISILFN